MRVDDLPGMPLTDALKSVGLSHRPSKTVGKRTIFNEASGEVVGCFFASEGWDVYRRFRSETQEKASA